MLILENDRKIKLKYFLFCWIYSTSDKINNKDHIFQVFRESELKWESTHPANPCTSILCPQTVRFFYALWNNSTIFQPLKS